MLWMVQRVFFETDRSGRPEAVADLFRPEKLVLVSFTLLVFFIGLYPSYITNRIEFTSRQLVAATTIKAAGPLAPVHPVPPNPAKVMTYEPDPSRR
jgi:NADH:ubiquinone oxidoreductase subunit 4 (subunit M)